MSPLVTSWEELLLMYEQTDLDTNEFAYTKFAMVEDDMLYYGQLNKRKMDISFQDVTNSLARIPDEDAFTRWSQELNFTKAPENLPLDIFIKRADVGMYDFYLKYKAVHFLPEELVKEAQALQAIESQPHPNIIRYYGCRVRRGFITGLVLDRHPYDLKNYLKNGNAIHEQQLFMASLESAINHLHSLGWAHNDLKPSNILVTVDEQPILIDFGSARRIGEELLTSRGTEGWRDCDIEDYTTSETRHDTFALTLLRVWLDKPTFDD